MATAALAQQQLDTLRTALLQNSNGTAIANLLTTCSRLPIRSTTLLLRYHDLLLFVCAYPPSAAVLQLARHELMRLHETTLAIMRSGNAQQQSQLNGSGIAGTTTLCQYSFTLAAWLHQRFAGAVDFGGADGDANTGSALLHALLPGIEYAATSQGNHSLARRLQLLAGSADAILPFLFHHLQQHNNRTASFCYDQLQCFLRWLLDDPLYSRSFLAALTPPVFYQDKWLKNIDAAALLRTPLAPPLRITTAEQQELCDAAKVSLALYHRETDPVTYADVQATRFFDMGRGTRIALYGMQAGRRLSLESYIGYMVFRNGRPIAYGGGWMLGQRCKIGVNIYPPFRGGESAWIFAQVLRLYHQHFGMQRFVVKPYQFGKGNAEGLRSGAFWFYYRLGFRPADAVLAARAAAAYEKRQTTDLQLLQQCTQSNLEYVLQQEALPRFDPERLSAALTRVMAADFAGDRSKALPQAAKKMKQVLQIKGERWAPAQRAHFAQLSLMIYLLPGIAQWPLRDKRQLKNWLLAKSGDERAYLRASQKISRLWQALEPLIAGV